MTTNGGNQETVTANQPVAFGDYQFEIYAAGLSGTLPSLPMVYAELEARAEKYSRRRCCPTSRGEPATNTPNAPTSAHFISGA